MMPPLFILTCARSGSTLLRLAMDSHPDIACPPELHLAQLAQRLLWTHRYTLEGPEYEGETWSLAIAATRRAIDALMARYLERVDKPIWCEKSVSSVNHLDVIEAVFPDARPVVLYRHAADMVASGLQAIAASPEGYDFEPYLAADPHRMQALLRYWVDKTEQLLQAEQSAPSKAVRLRYEDMVSDAEAQLQKLARTLDLRPVADWAARIYREPHEAGPGDATAYQHDQINRNSLGRGAALDWQGVSRNLVKRADRLLDTLGYAPLQSEKR